MRKKCSILHGFTLIELLIVISLIAMLSTLGIAAFLSYSRTQTLNTAVLDVVSMLNVAKFRAQSQVRPNEGACTSAANQLDGYQVNIDISTKQYKLLAVCGGFSVEIMTKTLPANISFQSAAPTSILFRVLSGGVDKPGTITISGYDTAKTITIDSSGKIMNN